MQMHTHTKMQKTREELTRTASSTAAESDLLGKAVGSRVDPRCDAVLIPEDPPVGVTVIVEESLGV